MYAKTRVLTLTLLFIFETQILSSSYAAPTMRKVSSYQAPYHELDQTPNYAAESDGDSVDSRYDKKLRQSHSKVKIYGIQALWAMGLFALGHYSSAYNRPDTPHDIAIPSNSKPSFLRAQRNISSYSPTSRMQAEEAPEKANSIAVVLRTWIEDAETALVAAESALEQIEDIKELVIVTDQLSAQKVKEALIGPLHEQYGTDKIKLIVEQPFLVNGHIQQKYSKMMADTYTDAAFILHLDSDSAITNWEDACFLRDGKAINEFDLWENLPDSVRQWRQGTFTLGKAESDIKHEYSRVNQHVYPRELYKKIRDKMEAIFGTNFKNIFKQYTLVGTGVDRRKINNSTLISDFNTLGAYAHLEFPDTMYQLDLSTGKPWRKICTTQCNARRWSNECCDLHRREQIQRAKLGLAVNAHMVCTDYGQDHPCHCSTEDKGKKHPAKRKKIKKHQRILEKQNRSISAAANGNKQVFQPCTTSTDTEGYKCGEEGYCYGSAVEDTCDKIVDWFEDQEDRDQYPDCICPEDVTTVDLN